MRLHACPVCGVVSEHGWTGLLVRYDTAEVVMLEGTVPTEHRHVAVPLRLPAILVDRDWKEAP